MVKLRYEAETGKVNLITNSDKEIPVEGCKYMTVLKRPHFNDSFENLYIKDGRIIAIDDTHEPPMHRIVG